MLLGAFVLHFPCCFASFSETADGLTCKENAFLDSLEGNPSEIDVGDLKQIREMQRKLAGLADEKTALADEALVLVNVLAFPTPMLSLFLAIFVSFLCALKLSFSAFSLLVVSFFFQVHSFMIRLDEDLLRFNQEMVRDAQDRAAKAAATPLEAEEEAPAAPPAKKISKHHRDGRELRPEREVRERAARPTSFVAFADYDRETREYEPKSHRRASPMPQPQTPPSPSPDMNVEEEVEEVEGAAGGGDGPAEEPLYCSCRQPSYGQMVECASPDCRFKWFHFACVGLQEAPPSDCPWYCPECTQKLSAGNMPII